MVKHRNIRVSGRVQGVFFRQACQEKADSLKITGFAQNMPDGSVIIEAEGGAADLDAFLAWCHEGSESAQIEKIEVEAGTLKHFTEFSIR